MMSHVVVNGDTRRRSRADRLAAVCREHGEDVRDVPRIDVVT